MSTRAETMREGAPPTAGRGPAGVIVCERIGHWAVALRRELAGEKVRIHETRSLAEAWEVLQRCPASFVVAELTRTSADPLLARLTLIERQYPQARVAVVAERRFLACQWVMREAGAVHFVVSTRELTPLARAIRRHLEQVSPPRLSLAEQVWAELPWGRGGA